MPLMKCILKTHTLGTSTSGKSGITETRFTLLPETTKITGQNIRKDCFQDTEHQTTKNRALWEMGEFSDCPNLLFWDFPSYSEGRGKLSGVESLRRPPTLGKKEINEENLGLILVTSDSTILEIEQQDKSKAEKIK